MLEYKYVSSFADFVLKVIANVNVTEPFMFHIIW